MKISKLLAKHLISLFTIIFLIMTLSFTSSRVNARIVFLSNDIAFQNATIVDFDTANIISPLGFVENNQNVLLSANGVNFDFDTTNSQGLGGFGQGITLSSYFPEGVVVTFSQPLSAIGFQLQFAECAGSARFIGIAAKEEHTFAFGQGNLFVGAADLGGITSVELNGTCFAASWSQMRFDSDIPNPPSPDRANLALVKNAPRAADQLDASIDFQLNVNNLGPNNASNVQIIDFPPAGTTLINSSPSNALVSTDQKVIVMGVGPLNNGDQYVNTLSMSVPPFQGNGIINSHSGNFQCNSRLLNIAVVTGTSIDSNTSNNTDTSITDFDKSSRQGLPEICDNGIDDNCDGRVDCGDSQCSGASNCRPPALPNPNNNPPQACNIVGGVIICNQPNFPGPTPAPAPPAPQSCIANDLHGRPFTLPTCCCSAGPCDRFRCRFLAVKDPNFKEVTPAVNVNGYGITQAGRLHEYTITYENIGDGIANDVQIFDPISPLLDDATLQIDDGGIYDPEQRLITWFDPSLPPREPRTVSFSINVNQNAQPGDRIRNQATILFPEAEQQRTDTNFVEHAIEDPQFPAIADLGVLECNRLTPNANDWRVILYNKGTAYAHNVSARAINVPAGINFSDNEVRFAQSDDVAPIETVVPLGFTLSVDTVSFSVDSPAQICRALTWRITYTTSEGEEKSVDVQVGSDTDRDGVVDSEDNCPDIANLNQQDSNVNGVGDACEIQIPAVCGDLDNDNDVDLADRNLFFTALRSTSTNDNYIELADFDKDGDVDFADYQAWYRCYREYANQ